MGLLFFTGIFSIAFTIPFFLTKIYIQSALNKGISGFDVNKPTRPRVAEMGGLTIFAGVFTAISAGVLFSVFLGRNTADLTALLASLSSLAVIALVGIFDDLFRLSWTTKSLMPLAAALPLVAVTAGDTTMFIPFLGAIDFGLFYTFILIPLGVSGAANAINMSAGYNGLEAGIGAVVSFFLFIIAFLTQATGAAIILAALFGACVAFLKFNWFPAKVFPGDVGTLLIGACIAAAVIIGNIERFGVILLIPAFYELSATVYYGVKGVHRREKCHNPVIHPDGKLSPPPGTEKYTLFYWILSKKPMKENQLVLTILGIYTAFGVIALATYLLKI